MNTIDIHDGVQLLKFASDDLKAINSVILTIGDHPEYVNAYEALNVIDRALRSITEDIQEAIDNIDKALNKKEQDVQQRGSGVSETA